MPLQKVVVPDSLDEVDCWFGNVDKLTLINPSSDELVKDLKQGYAMDFHYKGESHGDHWARGHEVYVVRYVYMREYSMIIRKSSVHI